MNTKVIYTCLTGNYDTLLQPEVVDNSFDFICFSNDFNETKIGIWEIRKIPFETNDNSRLSRYPKILSHKVLQDYEYSIYIDANIQIVGQEIYNIANQKIKEGVLIAQVPHPFEKCIYDDIKFAFKVFKIDFQTAKIQYQHLKSEGYPKNYGLFENNLIFRKHNVDKVITIMTEWWNEYLMYSKRDQFSLMYIY
ncbi:MAG: DUF616 domain-containing protein, partial [Bacteroidales bacterium]|nr:DUF616 domain-containing protein [Bacteroidales bacterium]